MKKERNSNIELLRIISMFMIIMLHFVAQSGLRTQPFSVNQAIATFWGCGGRLAVNVFVIIGAYFLIGTRREYKPYQVLRIWGEVLVYSITITTICLLIKDIQVSTRDIIKAVLPIILNTFWFPTCYIGMLLISPVINSAIKNLEDAVYKKMVFTGLFIFSLLPTIIPGSKTWYSDLLWFCYIYFLMGYLKNNEPKIFSNRSILIILFVFNYLLIFLVYIICEYVALKIPAVAPVLDEFKLYYSNHFETVPAFVASITLFYLFKNMKMRVNKVINTIGASTFAIYVIHQVPSFQVYLWNNIFHGIDFINSKLLILYVPFVAVVVIICGSLIDIVRKKIFACTLQKSKRYQKIVNKVINIMDIRTCIDLTVKK